MRILLASAWIFWASLTRSRASWRPCTRRTSNTNRARPCMAPDSVSVLLRPSIVVRTALPPLTLVATIRKSILAADPDQPIANVRTSKSRFKSHGTTAHRADSAGLFAVVAVSLACIGIYGVMSYAIGQRTRELSIRSALGAQRHDIIRLVLLGGMRPSILGIVAGLAAALDLAHVLESQLFEVKRTTRWSSSRQQACWERLRPCPSTSCRRAAKVDPMAALRAE